MQEQRNGPGGNERVVLGNYGLIKGIAVSAGLWLAAATVLYVWLLFLEPQPPGSDFNPFGMWLFLMAVFGGLSLLVGVPVGLVLGLLLRPVRRQWIHVAAFFAVPAGLLWAVFGFDPFGGIIGISVGLAAAAGRWSVCRDVEVVFSAGPGAGSAAVGP
ncbi:hypothetical protein OL239_01655 [Arthrobacter sp. ATA002]|uniref:hypothetical protein n=1 Tax=Arthrobacter sp. ATA002 TaxID=2991715 RepID=UPI0022A70235|nr:hypothetical protein [Arthrobacter sp. ATA002]WAP52058.1 hypothetical protein OL239_01655 [Arthrobacter sp. ATA002]